MLTEIDLAVSIEGTQKCFRTRTTKEMDIENPFLVAPEAIASAILGGSSAFPASARGLCL
jgi:hypothetical protein